MRAVVFDMDGLMFNTEDVYTAVGTEVLRRRGCEFTAELKDEMMGLRPQPAFEAMIRHCHLERHVAGIGRGVEPAVHRPLGRPLGADARLAGIARRLGAGGDSQGDRHQQQPRVGRRLSRPFELQRRFQFILAAEDIVNGKPHPEIYLTAARRFGVPPAEMVVLEDSQNGCLAAAAAGAFTVAVPGEHSREHDFSTASLVVDSLADPRLYRALGIAPMGEG